MSGDSSQEPYATSQDSTGHSNVSLISNRFSESRSDCSRLNKIALTDASSAGLATETSLDASSNKPHQQEAQSLHQRGSNQFGSDSGLGGCTNSISSENSLIVNATGIEQTEQVNDDISSFNRGGESGKHHGRGENVPGRLVLGARCGTTIDAALDNLSNNKITSGQRNATPSSGSLTESCPTNKSDTIYLKDLTSAPSRAKSNSTGLNPSLVSSIDNLRVDDAHKVKQSSRSIGVDEINSTLVNDDSASQVVPEKIDGARNNAIDHSHCSPSSTNVPKLRSALKKSTKTYTDASNRSPKSSSRNVSFNQTVIVFCEEIETSSPGEYDPPLDYRDSPDCVDSGFGILKDRYDSKCTFENGSNSRDLELLSKILGQDASKLTDEQLFGLLEGSSYFQDSGLNSRNNLDDEIFIQRLRSNQSYLCNEAISETDSESSLLVDEALSTTNQSERRPTQIDVPVISSKQQGQIHKKIGKANVSTSENQRNLESCSMNDRGGVKMVKLAEETGNRSAAIVSQASLPARVRATTIENQPKKTQPSSKPNLISKDLNNHQTNEVAQSQQKVIHSFNQLENLTNSQRVFIKQSNIDPVTFSKPQILTNVNLNSNQQNRAQPIRPIVHDDQICPVTAESDSTYRAASTKTCCDKYSTPMKPPNHLPTFPIITSKREESKNVQSSQTSLGCHICMAIESNRKPTNMPSPANSAAIDGARQTLNNPISGPEIVNSLGDKQILQPTNYLGKDVKMLDKMQRQIILQPDTSSQSCASCRELTLRHQHENLSTGSNISRVTQLPGQSQARPTACQIVYVVDQNGNRIRALQVVRTPQANVAQTARQLTGAPVTIRLPNPSTFTGEQTARQPIYVMQSTPCSLNYASSGPLMQSMSRDVRSSDNQQNHEKIRSAGQFINQTNLITAPHHRMLAPTQSGPKNHTIYYVQQPLGLQNLRNNYESLASKGSKSFPDVHEIRRLDGIRAPLVDSRKPRLDVESRFDQAPSSRQEFDETLSAKRDDADDPSFGFSNRPAVKVVSSVMNADTMSTQSKLERQNGLISCNGSTIERAQGSILGSQTLDRQFRNHLKQEMTDGIPNTSSMYEINQNLSYICHSVARDANPQAKSKGDQQHPVGRDFNVHESGNKNAHTRSGKDPPKLEVTYMMNI